MADQERETALEQALRDILGDYKPAPESADLDGVMEPVQAVAYALTAGKLNTAYNLLYE